MELPSPATIVEWNEADQLGTLQTESGARVRFGASACTDFRPSLGGGCFLVEVKPDPITKGVRAKLVNQSGRLEPELAAQQLAASEAQRAHAQAEADAARALEREPALVQLGRLSACLGHALPTGYVHVVESGALAPTARSPAVGELFGDFAWLSVPAVVALVHKRGALPPPSADERGISRAQVYALMTHELPFAHDGGRGTFCFHYGPGAALGDPPVVYCEANGRVEHEADSFEAFLMLHTLEGLTDVPGDRSATSTHTSVTRAVEALAPHLRADWMELLRALVARAPLENPSRSFRFVTQTELVSICKQHALERDPRRTYDLTERARQGG